MEKEETAVAVKKKRKTGIVRNKQENFGEENVKPGDNTRFLRHALVSWNLPPIDISDPEQVEGRIMEYLQYCIDHDRKPNMKGVGNWLGVDRSTVNSWKRGEWRKDTHTKIIQRTVDLLEELWIDYMQEGKIYPANGIFLAKNLFGYRDVVDIAPAQPSPLGERMDQKQLEELIESLPEAEEE